MKYLAILSLVLVACTNESGATKALEDQGFSDISLTGYEVFGCGNDDSTSTGFRAKNGAGKRVSGIVCCGYDFDPFAKGCTVRFK